MKFGKMSAEKIAKWFFLCGLVKVLLFVLHKVLFVLPTVHLVNSAIHIVYRVEIGINIVLAIIVLLLSCEVIYNVLQAIQIYIIKNKFPE